jgi:putative membrane protein
MRRITLIFLILYAFFSTLALVLGLLNFQQRVLTPLSTLTGFGFAVLFAGKRFGWPRAALLTGLIVVTGLAMESLGVATGLVYGPYHYTDSLGPKFLGLVPYLIPVAWTMMMIPALVVAERVLPAGLKGWKRGLALACATGVAMTAWDMAMDPMMVKIGHWVWETNGGYFGVPLQNFWGWWLTTFLAISLFIVIARPKSVMPDQLPGNWAVWAYAVTAFNSVAADLLMGLQGPALAGIFSLLPWVVIGFSNGE